MKNLNLIISGLLEFEILFFIAVAIILFILFVLFIWHSMHVFNQLKSVKGDLRWLKDEIRVTNQLVSLILHNNSPVIDKIDKDTDDQSKELSEQLDN